MKIKVAFMEFGLVFLLASSTWALPASTNQASENPSTPNVLDDFNPFDPKAEELLKEYDRIYERETGLPSHIENDFRIKILHSSESCQRAECHVWAQIVKSQQKMYLHLNGQPHRTWLVSTGAPGWTTPNLDTHPNGRIYDAYTSKIFPGGDWEGFGNMPFAVFVQGGIAIHGTTKGNWSSLGSVASHGCIRLHPDNAIYFNRLVRAFGVLSTWVTIQD